MSLIRSLRLDPLPVVTTAVGGNAEGVCRPELGTVVPFGDAAALESH